jgi:hypothetical protein
MRTRITLAIATVAFLAFVATAGAAQTFNTPVKLNFPPAGGGGEPSMAVSPQGTVMVVSPQGIPSGVNGHPGTTLWISTNDGDTFGTGTYLGSLLGGGDNDVVYDQGTWYEADLEAAAAEVCKSTDNGKTWTGVGPIPDPSNCTTINGGQAGPSDDRPWLTVDPSDKQRVYFTYHEFVSAQPIAFVTNNGGADDFTNACGSLVTDPSIEANVPTDITGGTLVARPVVDKQGNFYVLFATTTQAENAAAFAQGQPSGTFSQLYLAVSHDHCQSFTDYTVFDGSQLGTNTVQFGDVFNDLAIDGAGNLYVVGIGAIGKTAFPSAANTYVFSSSDHGVHWSKPVELSTPNSATMLPAAVGGPHAGQLAIGYFRTINGKTNPNDSTAKWTYSTAETSDATSASPTFSYADVNPGYDYHNGEICNLGILCGLVPGGPSDRSLLDFTSAALDPNGCPLFVFAGNPTGTAGNNAYPPTPTNNFVTRQLTGCFAATSSSTTTTISGAKTHKSKPKKHHKKPTKHHKKGKHISRAPRGHARHQGFTG